MDATSRFSGAVWFDAAKQTDCLIGGIGSIGSWLALALARTVGSITLVDMDTVDLENLGGQFFQRKNVGEQKTVSLGDNLDEFAFNMALIRTKAARIQEVATSIYPAIVFSCFDNMEARKVLFENWILRTQCVENNYPIFIDCRLGFDYYQIFCVTKDRIEDYRKTLFNDGEIPETPCTLKCTTNVAMMAAANMTGFLQNHLSNVVTETPMSMVPFFKGYNLTYNLDTDTYDPT